MPLTFGELKRRIRLRTGNRCDDIRVGELLKSKCQEIWTGYTWSWRYETAILATEAIKADGTVTLDPTDRTTVRGTGTNFELTDVGRNLRVRNDTTYYTVVDVELSSAFPWIAADAVRLQGPEGLWTLVIDTAHQVTLLPGEPPPTYLGVPLQEPDPPPIYGSIRLTASDGQSWWLSPDLAGQLTPHLPPPAGAVLDGGSGLALASTSRTSDLLGVSILGEATVQVGPEILGQELTLEREYIGEDFVDSSYSLFRNIYSLPSDFHELISGAYWWRLGQATIPGVDRYDARRTFTSNQPRAFIYRGEDKDGNVEIEISPVPSTAIGIRYTYTRRLPPFTDAARVPFSETFLEYLTAADALEVLAVELGETNLADAQHLLAIAERYTARGSTALAEARYEDFKKAGASRAVRDVAEEGPLWSDDYWVGTDLNSPIF